MTTLTPYPQKTMESPAYGTKPLITTVKNVIQDAPPAYGTPTKSSQAVSKVKDTVQAGVTAFGVGLIVVALTVRFLSRAFGNR